MRRRVLTALLALCMAVSLLPVHALAVDVAAGSGLDTLGIRQISEKKYAVTPDVTEYEWILNNASLTQQMMGHVMEIKVGKDSTASVAVGYGDDDIETIKTGRNWAMTDDQAGAEHADPPQHQCCGRDQCRRLRHEQWPPQRCFHHERHRDQ